MPLNLPTWSRPDFTPGGGDAFVLYGLFGQFDLETAIDRTHYRSARLPEGFELTQFDRHKNPGGFHSFFRTPGWEIVTRENPTLAEAAYKAEQMVQLRGFARDPITLDYLRDSIGIISYLLDRGGITCYDPQMLQLWTAAEWQAKVFSPARPMPHEHVLIIRTPDDDTEWIHTRGLRLFGRPDLSVHGVGSHHQSKMIELFNRYIEYQVNGGVILPGDVVTLEGLPPDGTCVPDDRLDHPDFFNRHVEICWPENALKN